MEKVKKQFVIEKSKFPEESGKYILWLYNRTKRGECWRGLFKGSKKECIEKKLEIINGTKF